MIFYILEIYIFMPEFSSDFRNSSSSHFVIIFFLRKKKFIGQVERGDRKDIIGFE